MGAKPIRAAWLLLVFITGTMKNYTSIELLLRKFFKGKAYTYNNFENLRDP